MCYGSVTHRAADAGTELIFAACDTPDHSIRSGQTMRPDQKILVNLSGRGDKDIGTVADLSGVEFYDRPSMRGLSLKGQPKGTSK